MKKLLALLFWTLPAFAQYSSSGSPGIGSGVPFQPLAKTSWLAASGTSANIQLAVIAPTYSASTTYKVGQAVTYSGTVYYCILTSTGNLPTNTTYFNTTVPATLTPWVGAEQVQVFNSATSAAFVIACATSSCTASVGISNGSTTDYPVAAGAVVILTVPTNTQYMAAILTTGTGAVYLTPGVGN